MQEIYREIKGELDLDPENYLGAVMDTLLNNFNIEELEGKDMDVMELVADEWQP